MKTVVIVKQKSLSIKNFTIVLKIHTDIDFEIYAVGTSVENKDWIKFINKHNLNWINVSDFQAMRDNPDKFIYEGKTDIKSIYFRNTYDIFMTPIGYLLDKDKKIIAKQFDSEQLKKCFLFFLNQQNNL